MYKWLAPSMQRVRGIIESVTGSAMDWSDANERNLLMYESAQPLADLYSPILDIDDTFVLQEYFVPKNRMVDWVDGARKTYKRALESERVTLLNTTIRMVEADTWSALPYAPKDSVAFVLYYRIERNAAADTELATFHHDFAELTVALGGRFYLPYRHHYSQEQLLAAYPEFPAWVQAKHAQDPTCVFSNDWFDHYGMPFWPATAPQDLKMDFGSAPPIHAWDDGDTAAGFVLSQVTNRRDKSMQQLIKNPIQWRAFREEFLVNIFSLLDPVDLSAKVAQSVLRARIENLDDHSAYVTLQRMLASEGAMGTVAAAGKAWRGLKQVHAQRRELLRQSQHILGKLGRLGRMDGLICVGDPGKLVLEFQSVCGLTGKTYVVNDEDPDAAGDPDIATVLTRRSVSAVGEFHSFSYSKPAIPGSIADASVDLVTMNQGLHHLPQQELMSFLAHVYRVLRPGGLFIVREHDATEELIPMCDAAHWVFNAVTGVSAADERTEVRAFRPILEWRKVLQGAGFCDSMLYDVEAGDPTQDEMMCFYKPPFWQTHPDASTDVAVVREKSKKLLREESGASVGGKAGTTQHVGKEHGLPKKVQESMDAIPVATLAGAKSMFEGLAGAVPMVHQQMRNNAKFLTGPQRVIAERVLDTAMPLLGDIANKIVALLNKSHAKQGNNMTDFPLDEIFLAVEMLAKKPHELVDPNSNEFTAVMAADYIWSYLTEDQQAKAAKEKAAAPATPARKPVRVRSLKSRTAKDVSALIDRLVAARPDLLEEGLVQRSGVSAHITKMLGNDRKSFDDSLFQYLDETGASA